ncbi:MAG: universal stress protein [Acidimicrobiia bacterium]|nr:universal stress protein [Acidimicrobiia bacterium]MDH3397633.1 universal stress protein [Acidimicrobiia bacterium]
MRRIIAAFDLTPVGRRVVERARLLAEQFGTHLGLLHVLEKCEDPFLSEDEDQFLTDHRHTAAAALVDWVAGRTSVPIDFDIVKGAPASQVARLARDADLLVFGTSSIDAAQLGPVTRRLTRMARPNVLAVRRQPRVAYRRVFAAVDLSEHSREAVELAALLAPGAEITVVYALSPHSDVLLGQSRLFEQDVAHRARDRLERAKGALDEFSAPWGDAIANLIVEGPPSQAIGEAARRRGADLVTVASRGAGATSMVLLGGTAEEIMAAAPSDVAVARVEGSFRRP